MIKDKSIQKIARETYYIVKLVKSKTMLNLTLNNQFIIEAVGITKVKQHIRFRSDVQAL